MTKTANSRLRHVCSQMKQRCQNPKNQDYKNYGGRGITVCPEWTTSAAAFEQWALGMPNSTTPGYQLNRIDNNSGYSPQNCNFISPAENALNKRNNLSVVFNGVEMPLATAILQALGGYDNNTYDLIHSRITKYKWTLERALYTVPKARKKKN